MSFGQDVDLGGAVLLLEAEGEFIGRGLGARATEGDVAQVDEEHRFLLGDAAGWAYPLQVRARVDDGSQTEAQRRQRGAGVGLDTDG